MLKGWHGHAGNKWQNIRFPAREHRLLAQMRHVQGEGREGLALHWSARSRLLYRHYVITSAFLFIVVIVILISPTAIVNVVIHYYTLNT